MGNKTKLKRTLII